MDLDAVTVELYIDGAWVDVTAYVLYDSRIIITRGRRGESGAVSPGQCLLTLYDADRDGRWSNRVPGSTYYGKLGRNTPLRVSVDSDVRCVMEIPTWAPRWDISGNFVAVPIQAAGILRRIAQGRTLRPPAERAILAAAPVAYWPLGDGENATAAASALPAGTAMTLTGEVDFAAVGGPLGHSDQPELLDADGAYTGQLLGTVSYTDDSFWQIDVSVRGEPHSGGVNDQMNAIGFDVADTTKFVRGELNLVHDNGASVTQINVYFYDAVGNVATFLADSGLQTIDGDWHHISIKMSQNASDFDMELWADGSIVNSASAISGDIGRLSRVYTPGRVVDGAVENFTSLSVANLAVYNTDSDPADRQQGAIGHAGETAGRRIERLCSEEGVTFASLGDLDDTAAMGPQSARSLLVNLNDAATADQGVLYETRTALGLTYRTRVSLYNQSDPMPINYSAGFVAPPLEPSEDDAYIHNDVTASRPAGTSARVTLDEAVDPHHTLTTQAPPDGVGVYDRGSIDANVQTDDQVPMLAYWRRHLGTWDELRYPTVAVELANGAWTGDAALTAEFLAQDTGDWVQVTNLPAWLPPEDALLMWQGYREIIRPPLWTFAVNATPAWPWEVWQMDTGASTLVVARDTDDTSFKLATSAGPAWSTTAEPYHLQVAGEAVTVTTITTDTPVFVNVGTVAHGNNASVSPNIPSGTTVDVGQVILGWAAIRNSGTGTVDLPAGWTELARSGNVLFFGRYYVTGVGNPTITFTGGAANADTSARLFAFSGLSLNLDDGRYRRGAASPQAQLNGSAQDIAYPALSVRRDGCVVFVLAWRQDDWTSVATPAAMDGEIIDNSTTTGDDQGIAAYYDIQTTATDLAAGSAVVTGGASAISRAITVALRPLQTATVTRGVNGASVSPAAGEAVNGWRLGVLAL